MNQVVTTIVLVATVALFCLPGQLRAQPDDDLSGLPLESLMELQVTSVSKKQQQLTDAAAAVFVITQEDIRRSGVTNIADALRMVPGVQVARIDSNKWAVSARGFNGRFANKLLVMMDGRSLYTPFFIGVYWEVQDTVMEDIERIEVIRGPGAALWGANAVNGVINIITKSAENTHGGLVSTGGGTLEKGFVTGRYGVSLNDNTHLRVYAKHQERSNMVDSSGNDRHDDWGISRGGFRLDATPTRQDSLTLTGEYYSGTMEETYQLYRLPTPADPSYSKLAPSATDVNGGNLLARWQRNLDEAGELRIQSYYDHSERNMLVLPQKFDTFDLDIQHRFTIGTYQDIVWGAGYRFSHDELGKSATLSFTRSSTDNHLFSAFVHDEINLAPNKLSLILGTRLEHNEYSGFEVQPNGRLIWTPTAQQSVWASVSRAVRTPTRGEQDINYHYRTIPPGTANNPQPLPLRLEILGNSGFRSEEVLAYETGYRIEPMPRLTVDLAAYYNIYHHLRVISPATPFTEPVGSTPTNIVQPFVLSNDMHGAARGVELTVEWSPLDWWRLQAGYAFERLVMSLGGKSSDQINRGNAEGDTPRNQFSLRSGFDLDSRTTLDIWLRGSDRLASIDGVSVPGYLTSDVRLAWRPQKNIELSLVGQNLFFSHHAEFIPEYINTVPSEVTRSMYGKVTWKF